MSIFGNRLTSRIIASIFQKADETARNEIANGYIVVQDERDRVSVLCREIRRHINKNPFIRSLSISAEPIDNNYGDALFVFRYKDDVKIGLVEAKLLRIDNQNNLNISWDWRQGNTKKSHFTHQLQNHQQWNTQMAVWSMFIPNCSNGCYSPPLIANGSSNIWSSQMIFHPRVKTPQTLWTYNDVLNLPNNYSYQNLYSIIKSILECKKGSVINKNGNKVITITSKENATMEIPIPYRLGSIWEDFRKFVKKYKNIKSYNYYRFDDLLDIVEYYKRDKSLPRDVFKNEKEYFYFKKLLDKNIK
jgi:hypothetical protein